MLERLTFPIVDTHLHVWDIDRLDYPWLQEVPLINKTFLLDDYNRACVPVTVERMVFVQCEAAFSQFMQEAEWVDSLADHESRLQGIVPWAPLENGDRARADLERLASNPRVKGIRRIIQFEQDITFCLRPDFVRGVQALAHYNLSFDICVAPQHLPNTIKLVQQCPNVQFVLDHCAKPDVKHQRLDPWRADIATLAAFPNVWCKISGLVTEADHNNWQNTQLKPYIDYVIEQFGFDRVMYAGDWPVASQAATYPRWVEALLWAVQACSPDELKHLFHDNAITFYKLA